MKLIELECPNCGGNLRKISADTARCPHCNTDFLIDKGTPKEVNYIYNQTAPVKSKSSLIPGLLCIIVFIGIMVICLLPEKESTSTPQTSVVEEVFPDKGIQSDGFKELVSAVFKIPFEKVTDKQLAQFTYFDINRGKNCWIVNYKLNNGNLNSLELNEELSFECDDLPYFKGLLEIYMAHAGFSSDSLVGLEYLTAVASYNSPAELADIIPHPDKIKSLKCYNATSLIGIDAFTSLESFYVDDYELSDISALSSVDQLKKLTIADGDEITDFGVIYSLTNLEQLYIKSEGLKDITFIESMPKLLELSIKDSIAIDFSALEKATALTYLELDDNNDIQDYSVISNLEQLETLIIDLGSANYMPSVEKWTKLKTLSVSGADDISFLASLPDLQNLSIYGCDCSNTGVFSGLHKLESLKIGSMYGEIESLEVLTGLTSLKLLDISSLTLYGDVEYLLSIPNLEELKMNDCSFGLDFTKMAENPSLKRLHMSRLSIWENIQVEYDGMFTYLDYDEVNMADHIEFMSNFPNLEELYLEGNKLTDLTFTEALPNLKKIDITNNYVTDLRPLGKLSKLEMVWCGENSISQGKELGNDVIIVFDSESTSRW